MLRISKIYHQIFKQIIAYYLKKGKTKYRIFIELFSQFFLFILTETNQSGQ